ncbi:MAG: phenylalanine--tRNA ligase subunit beta [Phycisphaerales bacterium]|nr:phenylalanine--tRNA ligase subunit beta [Phycisphaerales bacterium]
MLISLNWLRDFVDVPASLTAEALADQFTIVCAEVEGVEPIAVNARGLICAEVKSLSSTGGAKPKSVATLDVGGGRRVETVTSAPGLNIGHRVVYAPAGASVAALGAISDSTVDARKSAGMILPGDALGIAMAAREAVFLPPNVAPGDRLDPALFNDWVVEIDNHSINHRPDLWGHYGMAREFAAMLRLPLKPYAVTPIERLLDPSLPEIPIEIDDPDQCPRYSGLRFGGVGSRPAPLWMQLRLGHVGQRPIDLLVDLTNYIMLELGQPMHAFDGDKVERIEVGAVAAGTRFTTLDNVERSLPAGALLIQSHRKPIALAGVMGGAETEVRESTRTLVLESANFSPHVIRKCTTALGHRTEASARFEKSLDPAHTVLGIQRFVHLCEVEFSGLKLLSRLSDAFPKRPAPVAVAVRPAFVERYIGHGVPRAEMVRILTSLEFKVRDDGDTLHVDVPSFRATRDISLEVDIIEEVARYAGYNNVPSVFPEVTVRALEPNPLQLLERRTLQQLVLAAGMTEIHQYLWYDASWCRAIGYEPGDCLTLRNPAAADYDRMRQSLIPGLLAVATLNRHHLAQCRLVELGSAFPNGKGQHLERRRVAIVSGARGAAAEDARLSELKGVIDAWAWQVLNRPADYTATEPMAIRPWECGAKTAAVRVNGAEMGRVGVVPVELRRRMDEHLSAWSMVWAELELDDLTGLIGGHTKLQSIPAYPEVDLDFSVLVDATERYQSVAERVAAFEHALLRRVSYVDAYEGKNIPDGKRSMTLRARVGSTERTLVDDDLQKFQAAFAGHLQSRGMQIRAGT